MSSVDEVVSERLERATDLLAVLKDIQQFQPQWSTAHFEFDSGLHFYQVKVNTVVVFEYVATVKIYRPGQWEQRLHTAWKTRRAALETAKETAEFADLRDRFGITDEELA